MNPDYCWWRDGVIYQIYPRSFQDSGRDGTGDINGIITRLDYLAALGVDAIWLSPVYPSPDVDFGYDVADYVAIDARYGSLEDFDRLVAESHKRGIHVVMDQVFNHTSDQHPWFKASRQSRNNPYADWYLWADPAPGGRLPNNWKSFFGGPGWVYEPSRGQYYFHMFYREQPDLNWRNPEVEEEILKAVRFWLERGVDGFRLDVFNAYFKDKDLRSNPGKFGLRGFDRQKHLYDVNQPEMMPFLGRLRHLLDEYPDRYAVGETFYGDPSLAAKYTGPDALHATFDFSFLSCKWDADCFREAIRRWESYLGEGRWPNYVLNNHDNPRSATRYKFSENDARARLLAMMILSLRGTPFLYYGEEIGLRDIQVSHKDMLDPVGRYYWPLFKGRDGCRSPMQWDASPNGGFSPVKPWLPVNPDYQTRCVAVQERDPGSLLHFYRQMIHQRRSLPALTQGAFQFIDGMPAGVMAYRRSKETSEVQVYLNFSNTVQEIPSPGPGFRLILGTTFNRRETSLTCLNPEEGILLVKEA